MGYEDFVWFIMSEEDKSSDMALDYWFKCCDLDGDGCLRANEMLVSSAPSCQALPFLLCPFCYEAIQMPTRHVAQDSCKMQHQTACSTVLCMYGESVWRVTANLPMQ